MAVWATQFPLFLLPRMTAFSLTFLPCAVVGKLVDLVAAAC